MKDVRREIGQLAIAGFAGHSIPTDLSCSRRSSISAASSSSRATSRRRSRSPRSPASADAGARAAAVGQHRPGGRPRRPAEVAVHRVAADADARPQRRRQAWPSGSRARWRRSCERSASRSTSRRCSTSSPTRRIRSSATARWPNAPRRSARLGSVIIRTLQARGHRGLRQALSRPRRHQRRLASRAADRRASARPDRARGARAVQGGDRRRRRVDHDRAHPDPRARRASVRRRCRRASSPGCSKERSGTRAWSFSDDSR